MIGQIHQFLKKLNLDEIAKKKSELENLSVAEHIVENEEKNINENPFGILASTVEKVKTIIHQYFINT